MAERNVEVAPFSRRGVSLGGFVVAGRWPETTTEWAQFLTLAVRLAAVPGMVGSTTLFHTTEDRPDTGEDFPEAVGLVLSAGPVVDAAAEPQTWTERLPAAVLLLHPPAECSPRVPEENGAAAGCVFLPGLPHLGLEHRAAWVRADMRGTVTHLVSKVGVDPGEDPDTAVLAMLLAA